MTSIILHIPHSSTVIPSHLQSPTSRVTTEKPEDIVEKKKGKFVIAESSADDPIYKLGFVIAKSLVGKRLKLHRQRSRLLLRRIRNNSTQGAS